MKTTIYTDSNGKKWTTYELPIYDDSTIAPQSKWEFYSPDEIREHVGNGFEYACYSTSYDQFPTAHCAALADFNEFICAYITEEEEENE